jgi:hypothetical protein
VKTENGRKRPVAVEPVEKDGAEDEIRTRDLLLGKEAF